MFSSRTKIHTLLASDDVAGVKAARAALQGGEFNFDLDIVRERKKLIEQLQHSSYDILLLDAALIDAAAESLGEIMAAAGDETATIVLCHAHSPALLSAVSAFGGITVLGADTLRGVGLAERIVESIDAIQATRDGHIDARLMPMIDRTATLLAPGSDAVYRIMIENLQEGILTVSPEGDILYTNERVGDILRCDPDSLLGGDLWSLVSRDDQSLLAAGINEAMHGVSARCEVPMGVQGSEPTQVMVSLNLIGDVGGTVGISLALTDISAEAELRGQLQELAITDSLTRLFNRRHLDEALEREWRRAARYNRHLTCLMIDIDDFKQVNDQHGHLAGDQVLRQVASRIVSSVRETDIVSRFGGEEFAVLLPETTLDGAIELADRVLAAVNNQVFRVDGRAIKVEVSIGVGAAALETDTQPDSLLAHADTALSKAKAGGKNRVCANFGQSSPSSAAAGTIE